MLEHLPDPAPTSDQASFSGFVTTWLCGYQSIHQIIGHLINYSRGPSYPYTSSAQQSVMQRNFVAPNIDLPTATSPENSNAIFEPVWHKKTPEHQSRALWSHQVKHEQTLERFGGTRASPISYFECSGGKGALQSSHSDRSGGQASPRPRADVHALWWHRGASRNQGKPEQLFRALWWHRRATPEQPFHTPVLEFCAAPHSHQMLLDSIPIPILHFSDFFCSIDQVFSALVSEPVLSKQLSSGRRTRNLLFLETS